MNNNILIVEDEKILAEAVKSILIHNGYKVEIALNGKIALEKTNQNNYDIILMDLMMPIMGGIEALKQMRKSGINTPIILLTAKSQIEDKVEGLDAGANDYLTKPFDKKELLARIRALLRTNEVKKEKYTIGNIFFDKENFELSNKVTSFKLNTKECEIMEVLVNNQERVITEKELEKKIWNNDKNASSAVPMYISYLQNKFIALDANIFINNTNGYILKNKL